MSGSEDRCNTAILDAVDRDYGYGMICTSL